MRIWGFRGWLAFLAVAVPLVTSLAWAEESDLRLRVARKLAEKGQLNQALQEVRLHLAENPKSAEGEQLQKDLLLKLSPKEKTATPTATPKSAGKAESKSDDKAEAKAEPIGEAKTAAPSDAKVDPKADAKYQERDFLAAIDLYREGKKDAAQQKLRSVLGRHPKHAGAYYLGGVIRYEAGEFDKAAYNFKRAFDYPERGYNAHFYLGRIYQRTGRIADAIASLEVYVKSTPSAEGRERAEKMLAELRQKSAPKMAEKNPEPAEPKAVEPKAVEPKTDEPKTAEPKIADPKPIEVAHPHETPAPAPIANPTPSTAPKVSEQNPGATPLEDGFLFVIADSLTEGGRKLMQAHAFFRRDRLEQAVQSLKEVVRDFGGTENALVARLDLAAIYLRMGLFADARNQLDAFAAGAGAGGEKFFDLAHYLLGRAHLGEGKPENLDKAERYLLKVKPDGPLSPSQAEVAWQLAMVAEKMPDPVKRGQYLAKALALHPSGARHLQLQVKLGLHEAKYGKAAGALAHFEAAIKACGSGGFAEDMAQVCNEAGIRAADMAFRLNDFKGALARYQAFVKHQPKSSDAPWAMYQIGNTLKSQGRYDEALNQYQKVIDHFPENYWAAQAKWQREDVIWQKEYAEVLD